ncbi:unnamed protein product [Calypogeia fissa]
MKDYDYTTSKAEDRADNKNTAVTATPGTYASGWISTGGQHADRNKNISGTGSPGRRPLVHPENKLAVDKKRRETASPQTPSTSGAEEHGHRTENVRFGSGEQLNSTIVMSSRSAGESSSGKRLSRKNFLVMLRMEISSVFR